MSLLDQIQKDIVAAMKAKDEKRLPTLRMVKTALTKEKVDSKKDFDEKAELQVLNRLLKQRKESAEMFRKGGRMELADKEESEIGVIEHYLPAAASEEEMDAAVADAIAETGAASVKDMGGVMKAAQARLAGKTVDGKALSTKVRNKLQG
jgi:hypothetical protein